MFYGRFCAHGKLNAPSDLQKKWCEVKDETPFRYAHAQIRTQVVVICNTTRYQLDQGAAHIRMKSFHTYVIEQISQFNLITCLRILIVHDTKKASDLRNGNLQ